MGCVPTETSMFEVCGLSRKALRQSSSNSSRSHVACRRGSGAWWIGFESVKISVAMFVEPDVNGMKRALLNCSVFLSALDSASCVLDLNLY